MINFKHEIEIEIVEHIPDEMFDDIVEEQEYDSIEEIVAEIREEQENYIEDEFGLSDEDLETEYSVNTFFVNPENIPEDLR